MRWFALLVVVACSKDAPRPSLLVSESRRLADKVCACRDAACVDAVDREWNALVKDQSLSAEDIDAIAAETERYTKCVAGVSTR